MGKRRYSDDDRANALAALAANGGNVNKTAKEIGVPPKTIENWAKGDRHPEAANLGELKKLPMADALELVAWKLLGRIDELSDKGPLNQTSVSFGIAIDKMRLLRNQPTSINQNDLAILSDDELDKRLAAMENRAAKNPDGTGQTPLPAEPVAVRNGHDGELSDGLAP